MKKFLFVIVALLMFAAGCIYVPGNVSGPSSSNQLPTAYIDSITPSSAAPGEQITFAGHGTDVDGTVVAYRWRSSISGELSSMATFETKLDSGDHTIYLKVQDNNGDWSDEVRSTVTISGGAPPPAGGVPVISSFSANPLSISAGGMATLNWSVSNATTVTIDPGVGNVGLNGTAPVTPATTTNYTLTASNASGWQSVTITVTVAAAPPPAGAPDLVITEISKSGSTVSYTIKNQGTATAGPSVSQLTVDGVVKASDAVGPLSAGASSTESFSYSYSCSGVSDSIAVQADKDGSVAESNEGNNAYSETWSCLLTPIIPGPIVILKPDLIVTDVYHSGGKVKYKIKNQGAVDVAVGTVSKLYIDGVEKATDAVGNIAAGETLTETFDSYNFFAVIGHTYTIKVVVDSASALLETNETNNFREETWSY